MEQAPPRPYHHGDLRRALIETALTLLAEEQGWQFTLREVARRVGVSHAAPYKHFPDKGALLAALAVQGFEQLGRELRAAGEPPSRSVLAAFRAAASAYMQFGLRNPALYRLMFSAEAGDAASVHASERVLQTLGVLVDLLARGQQAGVFRRRPVQAQVAACWAQMHGLTLLAIEGLLLPQKVGAKPLEAALATLLEGLQAPPP
ncbi:MAG: TetR/AcrR family transcriptional regulator [Proteobacteria bacterium]|nr:TetR/AcrR family transcriptional regulator [Pseudomonadota bacterium]